MTSRSVSFSENIPGAENLCEAHSAPEAFTESSVECRYLVPVPQGTYVPLHETESESAFREMIRGRRSRITIL